MRTCGIIPKYHVPTSRDLLFFDSFLSFGGGYGRRSAEQYPTLYGMGYSTSSDNEALEAEYGYLLEQGLMQEQELSLDALLNEAVASEIPTGGIQDDRRALQAALRREPEFGHGWIPPMESGIPQHLSLKAHESLSEYESLATARLFSLMKSQEDILYTPILAGDALRNQKGGRGAPVINILLNAFPVPTPDVPYQDVIEFKREEKVQTSLQLMRRWMRKNVAKENVSSITIAEELSDALHDYTEHMRLAGMKYRTEMCQVLVTFPLATVERVLKLRFSQLFDPIFAIRKAKIALYEAELKAPGRELAFLHSAKERFGGAERASNS